KAMARTMSSSVERECGGVDRLGIRRPLKIRPKAGGRGSRGIDHPCIDHKSGPPAANSGVRVPLGPKKGAARLPTGEPPPIDRAPYFPPSRYPWRLGGSTPSVDNGSPSPVLSIGFLGRTNPRRALFAIADGRNPSRRNSRRDE